MVEFGNFIVVGVKLVVVVELGGVDIVERRFVGQCNGENGDCEDDVFNRKFKVVFLKENYCNIFLIIVMK